jgi:ribosomal protein S18 acetylase RimI-like enzyme
MRIRVASVDDAPAMGRVMVDSWLTAHRGQMPDAAWEKRRDEWTPEVSATAWQRSLRERDAAQGGGDVVLVAVDDDDTLAGLVLGLAAEDDTSGRTAEIAAIYVGPDRRGQGVGRLLLQAAAGELADRGFSTLHIAVLTANLLARGFYDSQGGRDIGERGFDEEGHQLPERVYEWPDISVLTDRPAGPG